jgi:beta-lactam-binding protein with PASTA domain
MSDENGVTIPGQGSGGTSARLSLVPLRQPASRPGGGACPAPDLIGLGFLEAYAQGSAAGLRLSVSVWVTTVGPWGRVLDQRPAPTDRLRRGGRIAVTVSGRPHEQVPDVRGLPLSEAIDRLVWVGFVPLVDSRRSSRSVSVGHVLATRPVAGTLLPCGSVVALTVASAQRAKSAGKVPHTSDDR